MRKSKPGLLIAIGLTVVLAVVVAGMISIPRAGARLPFDASHFQSTHPDGGPQRPVFVRGLEFVVESTARMFGKPLNRWSFGVAPGMNWAIYPLLNQCSQVNGVKYLMPTSVVVGVVKFGHTNTLDGPQFVAAAEAALQTNSVQVLDENTRSMREDHLRMVRFPKFKIVVVIPAYAVADFLRTNHIATNDVKLD